MSRTWAVLVSATMLVMLCLFPRLALAEGEGWDISISGFGGLALPTSPDIHETDSVFPSDFKDRDVGLRDSTTFGGKLTFWSLRPFGTARLNFGIELEAMQFTTRLNPQQVDADGTFGPATAQGLVVVGRTFANPVDFRTQIASVNFLWRYSMGVTPDLPNGRWYPYVGFGVGAQRTRVKDPRGVFSFGPAMTVTNTDPMVQGMAGLTFFLTRNIGLFGEYKYTHANHTFDFGTRKAELNLDSSHFLGGLSVHF